MVWADDKRAILPEPITGHPECHRKRDKNRLYNVITVALCGFLFFTFILAGFWFRSYGRKSLNIFILPSRNDSIVAKIFVDDQGNLISQKRDDTTTVTPKGPQCSVVSDAQKFDCYPNGPVTKEACLNVGCCYEDVHRVSDKSGFPPLGTPYCYYPQDYVGYQLVDTREEDDTLDITAHLERNTPSSFPKDIQILNLRISGIDENTLRIKITDFTHNRHEAPLNKEVQIRPVPKYRQNYDVELFDNGTLVVRRKSSGVPIFHSNLLQLVYADQFLQIATLLPTPFVYGLGEQYDHLLKNVNWTRSTLFNRDNHPAENRILYGTHPFYLALEKDHSSHGVFLLNSNSMDIILQPTPALTFRSIGGVLDLFIFLGPSSDQVVQQYTQIVSRPFMPPYWSLGFHLCRYNYNSLNETRKVWERTRAAGIPYDTQWNDIDYMNDHNDFTYDTTNYQGLPEFVDELHSVGMHYIPIIDPGIPNTEQAGTYPPYDDGLKMNVFIRNSSGDIFIGKVWNSGNTVFPDFSHPNATEYWRKQFESYHNVVPFDGVWIDMNEPANFFDGQENGCPETDLDNPPYVPGGLEPMRTHTLCMSAKQYASTHYNEHSLYAYREANATYHALKNITNQKRPFIISRASFSGQGFWSGHWSGDIWSSWEDMRYSVYVLLKFSLYGMPMMGSDICGFSLNTTVELCARWTALGSFYPFSRNHNDKDFIDQDPVALGEVVTSAAKKTLTTRYRLLPYLYTLFYRSHVYGETVIRPLFFEFPDDSNTYSIDEQFLWGPALLINPALYKNTTTVDAYFPADVWYDYYTGKRLEAHAKTMTLDAPLDSINLALRGGFIIPHQHSNTTTTESRNNKFFLMTGLDLNGEATGELYWDDGESIGSYESGDYNLIEFKIEKSKLTSNVRKTGFKYPMDLDFIKICGLPAAPSKGFLNGKEIQFEFDSNLCLQVTVDVPLLENFVFQWQ